jgi:hypothetical protein
VVTLDDVQNWVIATCNADPVLPLLVPGGVHSERVPESAEQPYAVMTVKLSGAVAMNSGFLEYPEFDVTLSVYADQGTAADTSGIQARMLYVFSPEPVNGALRGTGESVVNCRPSAGDAKLDDKLRNANDVCVCGFGWRIWCCSRTDLE